MPVVPDQTVGILNLERANSSLVSMVCCSQQQVLYLLHESGSVSVWSKRSQLAVVAATPAISRSASFVTTPGDLNDSHGADLLLEVSYESKVGQP